MNTQVITLTMLAHSAPLPKKLNIQVAALMYISSPLAISCFRNIKDYFSPSLVIFFIKRLRSLL